MKVHTISGQTITIISEKYNKFCECYYFLFSIMHVNVVIRISNARKSKRFSISALVIILILQHWRIQIICC